MTVIPTRRGFLGRTLGGLAALLGGKRAGIAGHSLGIGTSVPLAPPEEWRSLAGSVVQSPYFKWNLKGFDPMDRRVQVPVPQESPMAAPTFSAVPLYDESGNLVESVLMPPGYRPPGVMWGRRSFFLGADGHYREGMLYQVFTSREYDKMKIEGIVT
jgi:hypothetical protein